MTSKFDSDGLWLNEYASNEKLSDVYFKRATGALPEMESSKAVAKLIASRMRPDERVLDVGCGSAHYLRSLRREISFGFNYVGVDYHDMFLNKAKRAWSDEPTASFRLGSVFDVPASDGEFDIVMCNNLIMHLPSLEAPMGELIRSSRRLVVIRTLVGNRSFRIQEVFNSDWYVDTDVSSSDEFTNDGNPRAYSFSNIYSEAYFTAVIKRHAPAARIEYIVDDQFESAAIESSAKNEKLHSATQIIGGKQVMGYILCPYQFIVIDLSG